MTVTTAMIVAGGRGTRLQPLTHDIPKPLMPFLDQPFLLGVIGRLAAAGVTRVFLVVGADTTPFAELEQAAKELGVDVTSVPEPSPLDTAGGVREAAQDVTEPFFVLNGDILTDIDFARMGEAFETSGADAMISLKRVKDTSAFGVCVREGSRITRFVEKPATGTLPGQDTINAGTYVLAADVMDAFEPGPLSFERTVFPGVLEQGGHIEGFVWEGEWADLGTPDRWHEGHRIILEGRMSWPSVERIEERSAGVWVDASATVAKSATLTAPVAIFADAVVEDGATVGPHSVLAHGARVGAKAVLAETILGAGTSVAADVAAKRLITGDSVTIAAGVTFGGDNVIGSGETLGAGTQLAAEQRIPAPRG